MSQAGKAPPGWEIDREVGVAAGLGSVYRRVVSGRAQAGFLAEERHLNRHGVVHGGFLLAFLDHAMGVSTIRADGRARVTLQLNTHFAAPVEAGQFVVAECEVVRETGSLQFVRAVCKVAGAPVLMADGVWKALTGRERPASLSP